MKKDDISRLLQRFLVAKEEGKEPYFDADEIDELLNSFEESDDYTYYDEVLALGLNLHPASTALQIRKCKQFVYNNDYEEALALMDNIAETDNEELNMLRLECYATMSQYAKVIELTEELIQAGCDYLEDIFEYVAPIFSDFEMIKEARDYIDRGLVLFPDNQVLKNELCYILETEGDILKAIEVCNELIDKNPYSNEYWLTLGRLYSMIGDFDKAIEAFDFALTCDDSDVELKILKAYCLYMNESFEKALEVYTEISSDEETLPRIKPLMAECYIKLENYEKAYELLSDRIYALKPDSEPSSYINYIRCCVETNRDREASDTLFKAAKLFPSNIRILSLLALTYQENGEDDLAIATADKLFEALNSIDEHTTEDCETILRAGQYLYMKGESEKALIYYQKVMQLKPDMPYLNIHTAMAYLALGDMKRFGEYFSKAGPEELKQYMVEAGFNEELLEKAPLFRKPIPPEDLATEFLKNKDNSN